MSIQPFTINIAQADVDERWRYYTQLAGIERSLAHLPSADPPDERSE